MVGRFADTYRVVISRTTKTRKELHAQAHLEVAGTPRPMHKTNAIDSDIHTQQ